MHKITIKSPDMSFRTKEAYRTLRSNIEFSGSSIKTVAITSCTPSEGKSTVSFELARSFAQNGNKVLLIDGDLRRSVMRTHFGEEKVEYGVTNYLVGKCTVDQATCETSQEGLYVMLSGPATPSPAELLNSERFVSLLEESKKSYDFIIVDTPPLGSVIDSAIVAKNCDGALIVVAYGGVSYRFVQDITDQLKKADCRILGCVLNKVEMASGKGYYGKYYGRYYGKYYGRYYGKYYGKYDDKYNDDKLSEDKKE